MPAQIINVFPSSDSSAAVDITTTVEKLRVGDRLLAVVGSDGSPNASSPPILFNGSGGDDAGFNPLASHNADDPSVFLYEKFVTPRDEDPDSTTGYYWSGSASELKNFVIIQIRGDDGLDVTPQIQFNSASNPATGPSLTFETDDVLWISIVSLDTNSAQTITPASGFTSFFDVTTTGSGGNQIAGFWNTANAGATGTTSWSYSGAARDATVVSIGIRLGLLQRDYAKPGSGARKVFIPVTADMIEGPIPLPGNPVVIDHNVLIDYVFEGLDGDGPNVFDEGSLRFSWDVDGAEPLPGKFYLSLNNNPNLSKVEFWTREPTLYPNEGSGSGGPFPGPWGSGSGSGDPGRENGVFLWWKPDGLLGSGEIFGSGSGDGSILQPARDGQHGADSVVPYKWKMGINGGDQSGDIFPDMSGNQNDADNETTGAASVSDAPFGINSMEFDGVDDYAVVADADSLDITDNVIMHYMVNYTSFPSSGFCGIINKRIGLGTNYGQSFNNAPDEINTYFYSSGFKGVTVGRSSNFSTGTWYQVSAKLVKNGSNVDIEYWSGGTLIGSGSIAGTLFANSNPIILGATQTSAGSRPSTITEEWPGKLKAVWIVRDNWSTAQHITYSRNPNDPTTYWNAIYCPTDGDGDGQGTGCVPAGSGSGSGGVFPGSGSGSGGSPEEACYGTIHRDGYDRIVIWQPRTGNVLDVMGNEALNIGTPTSSTDYFDGGRAEIISKDDSFGLDLIRSSQIHHLKKMINQGCEFRIFGIGKSVVQSWFVDTKGSLIPVRRGAGQFAGARFETVSRHKSSAICQSANVLECFPWNMTVATERDPETPAGVGSGSGGIGSGSGSGGIGSGAGLGSGSGSGSGSAPVWELKGRRDDDFVGPLWVVSEGDSVDGFGRFSGTSAFLSYTFPVQGLRLVLTGNWAGTLVCKSFSGIVLETFTKTMGNDLSATIPDETWTVEWTVTSAFEIPRATVDYAGQKVAPRNGECIDCSDPDAQATTVDWSDLAPEIFFVDTDTEEFKTLSGDFSEEIGTGLDLSPYSILDIAIHVPTLTIYGLSTGGIVYKWKYDGSDFEQVFDSGFTDLERIHIDNKNDRIILGTHRVGTFQHNIYIYTLAGSAIQNFESRWQTNSITQGPQAVGTIGGTNYIWTWDGNSLYRFDADDAGAAEFLQTASGINQRGGTVDDSNSVGYRIIGSAVYQYNPVTINNPTNASTVAGNAPLSNSIYIDYFEFEDAMVWVGCDGERIWSWNVGDANITQNRSTSNALTLTTKKPFTTS